MSRVEMFDSRMEMSVEIDQSMTHPLLEARGIGEGQRVMAEEDRRRGVARLSGEFFDLLHFFLLEQTVKE